MLHKDLRILLERVLVMRRDGQGRVPYLVTAYRDCGFPRLVRGVLRKLGHMEKTLGIFTANARLRSAGGTGARCTRHYHLWQQRGLNHWPSIAHDEYNRKMFTSRCVCRSEVVSCDEANGMHVSSVTRRSMSRSQFWVWTQENPSIW